MNINENIRRKRIMVEKLRGKHTKLPLHQLLSTVSYTTRLATKSNLRHNHLTKMIKYTNSLI